MTLIVSLFAGPGSGKSTQAAGLFYNLKMAGINCELITETAKDYTWEKNTTALEHQIIVSAKQLYKQERVEGQVDCIITDCPIILGILYYRKTNNSSIKKHHFERFLLETFNEKDNFNVFIRRKKSYNPVGRNQTEEEAKEIDNEVLDFLNHHNIPLYSVDGTKSGLEELTKTVKQVLKVDK